MFNGYNEPPLISYDFTQERVDKKQENAAKWSYGHEPGMQPAQIHPGSRQSEFWSGKANFVGLSNVVKCSCTGCYSSSENQSYQGDNTCHRPWLPRTFPVPLNGSAEPYKLPAYQWDGGTLNQGSCYPETNTPFVPENGGKHAFYRHYQEARLPEPNQPGVITSLKNAEFGKKQKEEASLQNGVRQPVLCNPIYNLAKRADGRNYCDPNEKYSNAASFSVDQHLPRLPVVEPYIKAVPSNLSQNRVPSTGYRNVKENMSQSYLDPGYGDARKLCPEQDIVGEKRNENYPAGAFPSGTQMDCSNFGRDLSEVESQKLFFDNGRHSEYYSKKNFQNVINRNGQPLVGRKDCVISQIGQISEQQYNMAAARNKYQDAGKPSCETFYPKSFDKTRLDSHIPENSQSFQRNEDKNENVNVQARLSRSALIFNDPRFADRTQSSFPYQNNPAYRNYVRPEYPCQGYSAQHRYEHPPGFQRNDCSQYRGTPQPMQTCDQFIPQPGNGFVYDPQCQQNPGKTPQFYEEKNMSPILMDSLSSESKKPTYLEPIRSEAINKNGTNKISPLRLLRKKKFINVPHEPTPTASTLDAAPGLDVRKFWSTWAEEEEESVPPTQMVVLDCQNIDPEQAKLLDLYENDPVRTVQLESGSILIKNCKESTEEAVPLEEMNVPEDVLAVGSKNDAPTNCEEQQQEETNNVGGPCGEPESAPTRTSNGSPCGEPCANVERTLATTPLFKSKHIKSGSRGAKKTEVMDKWTEKKFDFLKRSEESKAAEMLRHEQEKKKIFETRLSLQQSLKKMDRPQEQTVGGKQEDEKMAERSSPPFDENSQSSSPFGGNGDMSSLPTSEYRRNKFLDYSEKKVIVSSKDKDEKRSVEEETILDAKMGAPLEEDEIKKENIKLESEFSSDILFPALEGKSKDKPCFEMDDILQKMSEINFQNSELKLENGTKDVVEKKLRTLAKKMKKRKSDHQLESEQRADKLTLETVKFSIQKSHDLKISFKVLNNSKKCSDEELGSKDAEDEGNPVEDSPNSTELITLKYKSIQGDRRPLSESKKSRKRFRRKKNALDGKTPVLKIRKSRYMSQQESDPLADYDDKDCDAPKKSYSDEYSPSDDFHVHETVDSAKIKLTFKRHKTGFEKQYKINSGNLGDVSELGPCMESENHGKAVKKKCKKKSRRAKGDEILAEAGGESFRSPEIDIDSDAERIPKEHELASAADSCFPFESRNFDEDAKNSVAFRDSCREEENYVSESATTGISSDTRLHLATPVNELCDDEVLAWTPPKEREVSEAAEDASENGENDQVKVITNEGMKEAKGFSLLGSSDENSIDSTTSGKDEENREKKGDLEGKGIGEISLDFISSTNSREIEINDESGKTEETGPRREENDADTSEENVGLETSREIIHSEIQQSSYRMENDKSHNERDSIVAENSCEWKEASVGLVGAPPSPLPLFSCRDEDESCVVSDDPGKVMYDEDSNEVLPAVMPEEENGKENPYQSGDEESTNFELPSSSCDLTVEEFLKDDAGQGSPVVETENPGEPDTTVNNLQTEFDLQEDEPEEGRLLSPTGSSEQNSEKCHESGVTPAEELQNTDGAIGAENCFRFGSEDRKESCDPECADISFSEKDDEVITPVGTPEEIDNNERKDVSPEKTECSSLAEKADATITNVVSDDVKDASKDSESENDLSISDKVKMTSPKNAENMAASSGEFPENATNFRDGFPEDAESVLPGTAETQYDDPTREIVSTDLPVAPYVELEDGEIVDSSSDELEERSSEKEQTPNEMQPPDVKESVKKQIVFLDRKIERRNSAEPKSTRKRECEIGKWSKRKFSKAKSCPREMKFTIEECKEPEMEIDVGRIPLPMGPPPQYSCFNFKKLVSFARAESSPVEAEEKPKESIYPEPMEMKREEKLAADPQNGRNPPDPDPSLGIFQRSSKIKFSLSRRSKFSKLVLKNPKELEVTRKEKSVTEEIAPDKETDKKDADCTSFEQSALPVECQSEQVPNAEVANGTEEVEGKEELKDEKKESEQPVELLGEDLEENMGVIGPVSDYMRDEFYEFEDIPTSEDLTNGDDLETEKVNDEKFRNIMQNCLDNAKKFLNVGNLKLFSCSVEDLLELDCQAADSTLEEQEAQPNHISRDVLLASCEDTNDDLGLSENMQPSDLSMDFVPSLCSDVCPEILPVDNWPYLEEEVPSSPIKSKQDEADLIPSLETASNNSFNSADVQVQFYNKNGIDRRKRVIGESFKRFRRKSLISESEAIRMCSKIGAQRRSTVDSLSGVTCEKDFRDIKSELLRWRKGKDEAEKQSLKCRLSLEKLRSKHGINFKFKSDRMKRMSEESAKGENGMRKKNGKSLDYKSPSWQPKVMLFRISKNEMRKLQRKSKSQKRPELPSVATVDTELDNIMPEKKKPKPDCDAEKVCLKLQNESCKVDLTIQNEDRLVGLSGLESIKGSVSMMVSTEERKRKKSRFRNLYTNSDLEVSKDEDVSAQKLPTADSTLVDAETVLAEMFKDCDRVSNPQDKSTKEAIDVKSGEKPKRKPSLTCSSANQSHSPDEGKSETNTDATAPHKEQQHHRQHRDREKLRKDDPRGDKRRKSGEHHYKHKDRHKDSVKHSRHESGRQPERSKHSGRYAGEQLDDPKRQSRDRSRSSSGGEKRCNSQKMNPRESWSCEVCGFNDAEARVTHIKSHPFHCQSCHLAFKTEAYFVNHLTKKHKNIRNQHHCLLCELSFDTEEQYQGHLETREHRHLESVEKNTINTLFTLLTGAPCPVLGLVEMKPEWLPNQADTVHFYHQATPLSLALQYLKMHHDRTSFSKISSAHPD